MIVGGPAVGEDVVAVFALQAAQDAPGFLFLVLFDSGFSFVAHHYYYAGKRSYWVV